MTSVGIRELRQRASELLRQVEAGQIIEITDRGRPVALLTPISAEGTLRRMRSRGEIDAAQGSLKDAPEPLPLEPGQEAPSQVLAGLRHDER